MYQPKTKTKSQENELRKDENENYQNSTTTQLRKKKILSEERMKTINFIKRRGRQNEHMNGFDK